MAALYSWLRRHPRLVDGVLAVPIALFGLAFAVRQHQFLFLVVAFGMTVPVIFRRAYPVGAFGTAIVIGAFQVGAGLRVIPTDLAIVILLYTLAPYAPRRTSVAGLVICLAGAITAVFRWPPVNPAPFPPRASVTLAWLLMGFVAYGGPCLIAWVLGDSMRYRRAYYASLEDRAARLERERYAHARVAAAGERARIARELHDVVAHNVSVMVVQADGAAYALDHDPARTREALHAIAATGRQALTEMRVLLGVLRRSDDEGELTSRAPLPGLDQLDELLDQTRAAGLPVSRTVEGAPQALPSGAALAAYRIIQESLTNTRKHAGPEARAFVFLRYRDDALEVTVADDGRGSDAVTDGRGHGMTGMAERAAI